MPLTPLREMQVLSGSFSDLMQMPKCKDYVQLTVTDAAPPVNAVRALHTVFPNCLQKLFSSTEDAEPLFNGAESMPVKHSPMHRK